MKLDNAMGLAAGYDTYICFGEVRRTLTDQYGGSGYYDRNNNEYMGTGTFSNAASAYVPTFGGDTYIAYFDYLRAQWVDRDYVKENCGDWSQVCLFPVETSVNLDMRLDKSYTKTSTTSNDFYKYLQEKAGDYSGMVGGDYNYVQNYDLYLENKVYNKQYDFFVYLPKIYEDEYAYRKDCDIMISEEYNRNEKIDPLIKFLPNNRKTLNSVYGTINSIVNYKNNIIVFQNKAVVNQPINERSLIQDSTGVSLVLGTGDILGRPQYISTETGCQNRAAVIPAKTGLYYYDSTNRSLYRMGDGNMDIAAVKGMNRFFSANHEPLTVNDTPYLSYGIHGVYDDLNNRILLTQLGRSQYTIGFNEKLDCFESLYSYTPAIYIKTFDNKLITPNPAVTTAYYLHDAGNWGQFYGSYVNSEVTLLVSKDAFVNKIFTNVEYYNKIATTSIAL